MTKGDAIRDEQHSIKEHLQRARRGAELLHPVSQEKPIRYQTQKTPGNGCDPSIAGRRV